ncbi:MAG: thiaminase II, partial [Actinomycetota bacterium]
MLIDDLRAACADDWRAFTDHAFVRGIADGTLPEAAFREYLVQDYRFLVGFARAHALEAY